jgi:hypothetical protein
MRSISDVGEKMEKKTIPSITPWVWSDGTNPWVGQGDHVKWFNTRQ